MRPGTLYPSCGLVTSRQTFVLGGQPNRVSSKPTARRATSENRSTYNVGYRSLHVESAYPGCLLDRADSDFRAVPPSRAPGLPASRAPRAACQGQPRKARQVATRACSCSDVFPRRRSASSDLTAFAPATPLLVGHDGRRFMTKVTHDVDRVSRSRHPSTAPNGMPSCFRARVPEVNYPT